MRKSYLFFLCFTLSRTPPARPLLALPPAFSETVIKKSPVLLTGFPFFWCLWGWVKALDSSLLWPLEPQA
jgi:hypothetical protein